jgi:mRNA interferase MazF
MRRMKSGMNYKQGSILLVPFPFTDLSTSKKRPVLVLSKTNDNKSTDDLLTCAITSKQKQSAYTQRINQDNLRTGKLPIESTILISKLFSIEKSLIIKELGQLDGKTLESVKKIYCSIVT